MGKFIKVLAAMLIVGGGALAHTISTAEELAAFRDEVNGGNDFSGQTITLVKDIDLENKEWVPIGAGTGRFRGTFNGNGYTIRGVFIDQPTSDHIGLFGRGAGTIKNLNLHVDITGSHQVGGLIGQGSGTIRNVAIFGRVQGNANNVGGITGHNWGIIESSRSYATVSGARVHNGGLVGQNERTIRDSYVFASVSGSGAVGGLVGLNMSSGRIENSYATGSVSAVNNTHRGGLVGENRAAATAIISSFRTTQGNNEHGILITEEELKDPATFTDWDFIDTWGIDPTGYINGGFPYLQAFAVTVTWDDPNFTFNGEEQIPTATATTANGDTLELIITTDKEAINAGSYIATATLKIPREFPFLLNATKVFEIKPKSLKE
ncbi:MAG: hypothetical protein FWE23_09795, partial [Chitinivibrionia bacterium]|nr:hypothetical protein [Chitinivibrionia bacterium]